MMLRGVILSVFLLSVAVPDARAGCWRGEPSPGCDSFWITEFGLTWRLDDVAKQVRDEELYSYGIRYEVGPMFNLGDRYALGGTITLRGTGETSCGLNGRLRYWMSRNWSFDLSPGIIFYSTSAEDEYELLYPSLSARLVLNYADFIGISGGVEQIRVRDEGSEFDWHFGMHAASYPGAAIGLVFLVLAAIAVAAGAGGIPQ